MHTMFSYKKYLTRDKELIIEYRVIHSVPAVYCVNKMYAGGKVTTIFYRIINKTWLLSFFEHRRQ